ncbi:pyrimidine 5'-nucleotidase [Derxia lacustris]|uniref:pyrimidine 5'-nucleotidase n=1 Tax=Derxia lacustris TaxID=764842 RepID=UPI001F30DF24|nr:pyrimidine 5'-nucleotidase [Derxia lacustris]
MTRRPPAVRRQTGPLGRRRADLGPPVSARREIAELPAPRRAPVWLFDLDNTLHDTSTAIFPEISRLMTAYIVRRLGYSPADADRLRRELWQRYGATLLGLVREHGVDAAEFLREAHAFDDLAALIVPQRGLAAALRRLPGRKILFTNGPRAYAEALLFHLGIDRHFQRCVAVEQMTLHGQLRPKPSRPMLRALLARERVDPRRCVLVEDSLPNLVAARALGMSTVLMTAHLPKHMHRRATWAREKITSIGILQRKISRF